MYELLIVWLYCIALLNLSTIAIYYKSKIGRTDLKTTCKSFVLVDYQRPVTMPLKRPIKAELGTILLADISERDYSRCKYWKMTYRRPPVIRIVKQACLEALERKAREK